MAVCVACMAIYWPTPGFKVWTFKLFVVIIWDFNFCVRCSPLRDCLTFLSTSWLGSKHQLTNKLNCSHPFVSQDLQVRIFVFSVLPFCRTDKTKNKKYLQWSRGDSSDMVNTNGMLPSLEQAHRYSPDGSSFQYQSNTSVRPIVRLWTERSRNILWLAAECH